MTADVPVLTEEEELAAIKEGYAADERREADTARQRDRWFWVAVALIGLLAMTNVYDHLQPRERVDAFVAVVRQADDGHVLLVEGLKPMRDFVVPAEAIQFMLSRLVVDLRRKGSDPVDEEDRRRNVEASVCGPASQQILKPPVRDAALVAVNLQAMMPTDSPRTRRGQWVESWYDARGHHRSDHTMIGDLTVARRDIDWNQRDAMEVWKRSPLSLCVQAVIIHEVP